MNFDGKVVIVTGSSSGIGAATAKLYAKYAAKVVLTGRNQESLNKIAEECEAYKGIKPLTIAADLSELESAKKIIDATVERFGGIDILVNNAGAVYKDSIRNINVEDTFTLTFNTNLRSVYLLTHYALPHLIKSKGNIVNVSSIASKLAYTDILSYSMSKAALDQFTRIVANDLGPDGVRVNSVNPGAVLTNITRDQNIDIETFRKILEEFSKYTPLQRIGESEDIGNTILYLSSDLAKNITGAIVFSDGGHLLATQPKL